MPDDTEAINDWRQGDVCLDVSDLPVLVSSDEISGHEAQGAVVISQCCDIVRTSRPYLQVAALVEVEAHQLLPIKLFREPRLALIPSLEAQCLVANLDVVATVAKEVVRGWNRTEGCRNVRERRAFSYAVGRHKNRVGFPDPWAPGLEKLRKWVKEKGAKPGGPDGQFINALDQMRILGDHVDNPPEIELICILNPGWTDDVREQWVKLMVPKVENLVDPTWCPSVICRLVDREEISYGEYMESFRLDFGALTER